jgi:hypothetical protein
MSEKRSWDIQPRAKAPARPQPAPQQAVPAHRVRSPAPRSAPAPSLRREAALEPVAAPIIRREKIRQGRDREPLKERRRRERRRMSLVLFIVLLIFIAGVFAALWSPVFRVRNVEAAGPDSSGVQAATLSSLTGTYKYVLPRNSIFFFSEDALRAQILQQYPDISAIAISRISFDTIAVNAVPREAAFLWCGATYMPPVAVPVTTSTSTVPALSTQPPCYDSDSQGDIFAVDTNPSSDMLRVYDTLASSTSATNSPLGDYVAEATMIPNALDLVKEIKSLDVPVVTLVIRGDEADMYAQSGTRITYVLGTEEATAELAESAFPSLNLNDGSLEYVDLRFSGKVYFRKVGASDASASATSTYSSAVSCYLSGTCQIH